MIRARDCKRSFGGRQNTGDLSRLRRIVRRRLAAILARIADSFARFAGCANRRQPRQGVAVELMSGSRSRHAADRLGRFRADVAVSRADAGVGAMAGAGRAALAGLGLELFQRREGWGDACAR